MSRGEYKARNGERFQYMIEFDPNRIGGLKEWCRHAIKAGGKATKADSALTLTLSKENHNAKK